MSTVNTSGGGDYLTLAAWVAGTAGDAGGGSPTATCSTSDGTVDGDDIVITGFSNYAEIIIEAAPGHEAVASGIDISRYQHEGSITINQSNIRVNNLQKPNLTSGSEAIFVNTSDAVNPVTISGCFIKEPQYGFQGNRRGLNAGSGLVEIENSIFSGDNVNSSSDGVQNTGGTINIKNSLIEGFGYCLTGAINSIYSSVLFAPITANWNVTPATISYCASDTDISGFGSNNFLMAAASSIFNNPTADDFTLLNYTGVGALIDAGDPSNSTSTDIAGTTRDINPDVGPFEFVSASGHIISIDDIVATSDMSDIALSQAQALSVSNELSQSMADVITVLQHQGLAIAGVVSTPSLSSPVIAQHHTITLLNNTAPSVMDAITTSQGQTLLLDGALSNAVADAVVISQGNVHVLVLSDSTSPADMTGINLSSHHQLAVDNAIGFADVSGVVLSQSHLFAIADVIAASTMDEVAMVQGHNTITLIALDTFSQSMMTALGVTQLQQLSVADAASAAFIDSLIVALALLGDITAPGLNILTPHRSMTALTPSRDIRKLH